MYGTVEKAGTAQMLLFRKVYFWMSIALVITGLTSWVVSGNQAIMNFILGTRWGIWVLLIIQFSMVWYLSARIMQMTLQAASVTFILYSVLCGVTFSYIFLLFTTGTIAICFFITAGMFLVMSLFGFFTKKDLSSWGSLLIMGLFGIIIASVVNFFFHSKTLYWIISYIGIIIFVGLTAYDTQKLKALIGQEDNEENQKIALIGALALYLDFLNIFLFMLSIFGGGRRG